MVPETLSKPAMGSRSLVMLSPWFGYAQPACPWPGCCASSSLKLHEVPVSEAGLHQKRVLKKSVAGLFPPWGQPAVPVQPQPSGYVPLSHAQALQLGQKRWPVVPSGIPVLLQMGTPRLCKSVDGEHMAGTTAEVGAATNTQAPWEGHGVAPRCSQQ